MNILWAPIKRITLFLWIAILCISIIAGTRSAYAVQYWQPGFVNTSVVNDPTLNNPTGLEVAPDGRIFIAERGGAISVVATPGGTRQVLTTIPVDGSGERGLLNIALDNDFASFPYMYAFYTGLDSKVRIGKMAVTPTGLGPLTVLYTGAEAYNQFHNGGGLDTDMQGHIYFSQGENYKPELAQNVTVENGKVMRINSDGSIPADNPYLATPNALPQIYAVGLRNPFRLSVDRATGDVYVGDPGADLAEEINHIQPERNYGWPDQEGGRCSTPCTYELPIYHYDHTAAGAAIIAGPVYRGSSYPASFQGQVFFGDWMTGVMDTVKGQSPHTLANFSSGNGNIVDFDLGADGKIYFIEHYSGKVWRIDYSGETQNHEPVVAPACSPPAGPLPLTVACTANASDADGDVLTYAWDFGDGTSSTATNPSHTFTTVGAKQVFVTVSDGKAAVRSQAVTIQAGQPPLVSVTQPQSGHLFKAGETLNYTINAQDATGNPIPGDRISVKINLHHNEHEHDFMPPTVGSTGSVQLPVNGETEASIFYRLYATATDTTGLQTTVSHDVQLQKTSLTLKTSAGTGMLKLDGKELSSGTVTLGVVGLQRTIEAPATITDATGRQLLFDHWSDNGTRIHGITFPETDTTLTALYRLDTSPSNPANLLSNPSLESFDANLNKPASWYLSRWGNMSSTFAFQGIGKDNTNACGISALTAPDGTSSFCHPFAANVEAGSTYTFANWYKSSAQTALFALYMNDSGRYEFRMLTLVDPSADWKKQELTFTVPAGVQRMTIFQNIFTPGTLTTDDYFLAKT